MTSHGATAATIPRRVALVDDHPVVLDGLVARLGTDRRIRVVATGSNSADARRIAVELHPDVLILDVELHGDHARVTIQAVHRASPQTAIVVLTAIDDSLLRDELLRAGASAYLTKATGSAELIEQVLTAAPVQPGRVLTARASSGTIVTNRELQVLQLLVGGASNQEISDHFDIANGTVKRHLFNLYGKLHVSSRSAAIAKANLLGLLGN